MASSDIGGAIFPIKSLNPYQNKFDALIAILADL
jgi:hypothetical protein